MQHLLRTSLTFVRPGLLAAALLFTALLVSCERREETPAVQSPAQGAAPAAPNTSSLANEACDQVRRHFKEHWSPHGDSWLSYVKGTSVDTAVEFVEERKGLVTVYDEQALSDADKLNGLAWKGSVFVQSKAFRRYYFQDQPESGIGAFHSPAKKRGWTPWEQVKESDRFWLFNIQKSNDQWKLERPQYNSWDPSVYQPVKADASGGQAFDPETVKPVSEARAPAAMGRPGGGGAPRIVYIGRGSGNPYLDSISDGFRKAAQENGCEAVVVAPDSFDPSKQAVLLKDQIAQGAAVICISPTSWDAFSPLLQEAKRKGIPIVTIDSDVNNQDRQVAILSPDTTAVGEGQLELLGSMIDYQGEFAILSATADSPVQNDWIAAMKKALGENPKYAQMKLVAVVYGNDDPQKSQAETEVLLARYPNLRGIIAPTTVGLPTAARVVAGAGKAGQVIVTGLGLPTDMKPLVRAGTVQQFALWNPSDYGYLGGYVAAGLAKGTFSATPGSKIVAGALGERTLDEKGVLRVPLLIFNKSNIDQFKF